MKPSVLECREVDFDLRYRWVDLRTTAKTKRRGQAKGRRGWGAIHTIVLHQTAVDFGYNPTRVLNLPVHGCTLQDGTIVLLHSPLDYMWHAHTLNDCSIGIEVSCRAGGREDDPTTPAKENVLTTWLPKSVRQKILAGRTTYDREIREASSDQLMSTRALVKYYCDLVAANGGQIEFIRAHRQSHRSRVSDPGERIWKNVGIWAQQELYLSSDANFRIGSGNPLPDVWTGENNGIPYNWRG